MFIVKFSLIEYLSIAALKALINGNILLNLERDIMY